MSSTNRERVIELATLIAAEREKLRKLEAEMDTLLAPEPVAVAAAVRVQPTYPIESSVPMPVPLTERVIDLLRKNADRAWGVNDVAKQLAVPTNKMNTLRATLFRLVEERRIDKAGPGMFKTKQGQHVAAA